MVLSAEEVRGLRVGLALLAAALFLAVAFVLGRRPMSPEARPANRAFQAWWIGLAAVTLYNPLLYLMDKAGLGDLQWRLFAFELMIVSLMAAAACLVFYLLYVYTGSSTIVWPIALYTVVLSAWIHHLIAWGHPMDYGPHCPQGTFCYENAWQDKPAGRWVGIALVLPLILAAVAYFALVFRVPERAQRYRVSTVSGALIVWLATSLAGNVLKLSDRYVLWPAVTQLLGATAALVILLAYRPPRRLRAWLEAGAR